MANTVDQAIVDDVNADIQIEGVERFEIVLTNNHKDTYHPGQLIEGHVLLHLSQSIVTRGQYILKYKIKIVSKVYNQY